MGLCLLRYKPFKNRYSEKGTRPSLSQLKEGYYPASSLRYQSRIDCPKNSATRAPQTRNGPKGI